MEIAKHIPELYPDLAEHGGLAGTLQAALSKIGSSLFVSELDKSVCNTELCVRHWLLMRILAVFAMENVAIDESDV